MTDALKHGSLNERRAAAFALGMTNSRDAVEPLIETLAVTYGEDEELAPLIVQSLGGLHDTRAVPSLKALLADRRDDEFYFFAHRDALFVLAELDSFDLIREFAHDETRDDSLRREAEGLLEDRKQTNQEPHN